MAIKEKVAYLKGLAEGLGLDAESKEGKLILVIIDTLAEMSEEIEMISENTHDISDELDAITDTLADVEEFLFDDDYDDDDFDDFDESDFYDDDDDDDDDHVCGCGHCQGVLAYEIECPNCGEKVDLDDSDISKGSVNCAGCGQDLEIEFDDDDV